jgi:succinate dehydrogenase / fumarate reductase, cytochrome b subunit
MAQAISVARKKKLPFPVELYQSAIGKKYVMAVTGLFLTTFVLGHMVGNLKLYLGLFAAGDVKREEFGYHINEYGEFLRELGEPILPRTVLLWIIRSLLAVSFLLHMHAAYSLTMLNRRARVTNYASKSDYQAANFASRSMRYTGTIVILYLVWHILDLTWGVGNGAWRRGEVYQNVDSSLSRWPIAIVYIVANLALGVHLFHGLSSFFQSLGWNNPRFNAWKSNVALGTVGLILLANISFPIAVLAGVISHA